MDNFDNIATLKKRLKSKYYSREDINYFKFLIEIEKKKIPPTEIIFQLGLYIGQSNLSRYLNFYELYKKTLSLRGNCCDIGTWKGSSFLFIAKLIKIFEPHSKTKVYGFDWFKGQNPGAKDNKRFKGKYKSSYDQLLKNINYLELEDYIVLEKMNLAKNFSKYLKKKPWLEFKYAFVDCGSSDVLEETIKSLWPRISVGGILILDHFSFESTPQEKIIVRKHIKNHKVQQLPFSGHPAAYIQKKK